METRYDLVLLDADDTLFDFGRAERYAFFSTLGDYGRTPGEEDYQRYSRVNESFWERMTQGEISKGEVVTGRFVELLREQSLDETPHRINERFQSYMRQAGFLLPGAEAVCAALSQRCTLAIATNGVARTQRSRLEQSALKPYISHLVISEEAGVEKPGEGFFTYALKLCGKDEREKDRVLMVGDSFFADIKGAYGFGIDACWYNPRGKKPPEKGMTRYVIQSLEELVPIVLGVR